jgi:chemotaxis protein MotB
MMKVADTVRDLPNVIRVEGHTDDVPIHTTQFASNWELSTARATRVVQLLIEQGGLPADRLSAAGYGEYHPRVGNDSAANRARNRRVDIVIVDALTAEREEPGAIR